MIDHITFGIRDSDRATAFYDAALAPLGLRRLIELPTDETDGIRVCAYGADAPCLWLAEERAVSGMLHIALSARDPAQVRAFHAAALRAGGICNGPPGLRPHYHASYYAAFVRDPDGHNIEVVCHEATPQG